MFPEYRYYYLHNFQRALAWIEARCADLLDEAERGFLSSFAALPPLSQALLVRLLMRRGPWFRASRLAYEEIPAIAEAAAPLLAAGWLAADDPMTLEELFALSTKAELAPLCAEAGLDPGSMRKADLLAALQARAPAPRRYAEWRADADIAWKVRAAALCERLRLMFFGNLRQDWSEFVLADLGVFQYEQVPLDRAARAFQSRADIDCYLALAACREAVDDGADVASLLRALDACASANPWLEQRRAKVLLRLGQRCEREGDWGNAEGVYAQCAYPGARHRLVRVRERMGRHEAALALALQALRAPEDETEAQRLARMLPRLRRALGLAERPAGGVPGLAREDVSLPRCGAARVEEQLRAHLHRDEAPVHYVENTLINALFGLLCWPAVFAPVPGAFFHPFQRGPADLDAPDFHARRRPLFDACLAALDDGSYRDVILRRHAEKAGIQSPFVSWAALTEPLLRLALDCIAAPHLKLYFQRLARDVRNNRSGLPDLIRFWPSEKRYELIEVKGPGDRLQDNQIRWLRYCAEHGLPARVCHVTWQEEGA
ncbi:VRR-NUC domain-containing protein [Achromobacter sp. Marseille-Q4962]|uniref:VRR-NUC domain-containing protein n=1 Tax=Achromobacter sp. Marseille-Q4962 TaxID=2942202 RepID=UPI0020732965|nr:VRR-NUC domain-containing protein [Achromobacter sp. Marseille-Q4962]